MKIGVSGAAGGLGRMYVPEFIKQGNVVSVYDKDTFELKKLYTGSDAQICNSNAELAKYADVVLLYVPTSDIKTVLQEMHPYFKKNVILGSASSSKEMVAEEEKIYAPKTARIVEFHPMHSGKTDLKDRNLITVPVIDYELDGQTAESILQNLFASIGLKIKHINSPEEHDRIAMYIQGGTHLVGFSMAGLELSNETIFRKRCLHFNHMDSAKYLFAMRPLGLNLDTYAVTIMKNNFVTAYAKEYNNILSDICKKIKNGKKEELYRMFEEDKDHLGNDEIKNTRKSWEDLYGTGFDSNGTITDVSLLALGELAKLRGVKPTDFMEFEGPHHALGRMITYGIFSGDIKKIVDNLDNPDIYQNTLEHSGIVELINNMVQYRHEDILLDYFKSLKKSYNLMNKNGSLEEIVKQSDELIKTLNG